MKASCGEFGESIRADCMISASPADALKITVRSTIQSLYGEQIHAQIANILKDVGSPPYHFEIDDAGALSFTISARLHCVLAELGIQTKQPKASAKKFTKRHRTARLYVPGDTPKYMAHVGLYGADAIIFDLEDSVSPINKTAARILVRYAIEALDFGSAEIMIRVNSFPNGLQDLCEFQAFSGLTILIPKVESSDQIRQFASCCGELNDWTFIPIIESALGLLNLRDILQSDSRIAAVTLGVEDYVTDIGATKSESGKETSWALGQILNTARALGIQPLASVYPNISDDDGLRAYSKTMKDFGFEGVGCLHPRQVPIVLSAFAPSEQELVSAKKILEAASNHKGVVAVDGAMVDTPIVLRAQKLIDRWEQH